MYVVIEESEARAENGVPDLDKLQEIVGGYIEGRTLERDGNRHVMAYWNEGGPGVDLGEPNIHLPGGVLVCGPVVVTMTEGPDEVAMEEHEVERIRVVQVGRLPFPSLVIE